jgi:hypothetical protein
MRSRRARPAAVTERHPTAADVDAGPGERPVVICNLHRGARDRRVTTLELGAKLVRSRTLANWLMPGAGDRFGQSRKPGPK